MTLTTKYTVFPAGPLHVSHDEPIHNKHIFFEGGNSRAQFSPVKDDGCYRPSQSFSIHELVYGIMYKNWPKGMMVQSRRSGEVLTFNGLDWIKQDGKVKKFGIFGCH